MFTKNGSERGELTLKDITLNREELIEKRFERIKEIDKGIKACFRTQNAQLRTAALEAIKQESCNDKEYSLVIKAFINDALD